MHMAPVFQLPIVTPCCDTGEKPTHPHLGGHRYLLGCLQPWCKSSDTWQSIWGPVPHPTPGCVSGKCLQDKERKGFVPKTKLPRRCLSKRCCHQKCTFPTNKKCREGAYLSGCVIKRMHFFQKKCCREGAYLRGFIIKQCFFSKNNLS